MKTFKAFREEDIPEEIGNMAGSGAIAGIGVGPQGEPGVDADLASGKGKKAIWPMQRRKDIEEDMFAGAEVFDVSPEIFQKCRLGKVKFHRWSKYVGDDPIGQKIRAYGLENPKKSIIVRDNRSGAMMFLRHGSLQSFASYTGC